MSRGVEVEEGEEGMSWGKEVEWVSASSSELTSPSIDTDTTETYIHTQICTLSMQTHRCTNRKKTKLDGYG